MFSIRFVFIYLLIIYLLLGGIFVFVTALSSESILVDELVRERQNLMYSTGEALFSPQGVIRPNTVSVDVEIVRDTLLFTQQGTGSSVVFFRLIDATLQQIVVSSNPEEDEKFVTRLPVMGTAVGDVVSNTVQTTSGERTEITYRGTGPYVLWMGLTSEDTTGALARLTGRLLPMTIGFVLALMLLVFGTLYLFLFRPMWKLEQAIERVGSGSFDVSVSRMSQGALGRVFEKFFAMIQGFSAVRERDEFVSSMKSDFITTAAHQLRTPLSAVKWALKILIDQDFGPLNVDQKTILMKGYESNDRMVRLVNDLLDVDRIDSGRLQYEFAPIDIINLINSVLVVVTPRITERKLAVVFANKEKAFPPVKADSEKLRQVVQNLIDNAIKYSYPGGKITLAVAETKNNMLAISVGDTGIGIPKEQQAKLFGKFFRAENARKLQTDGSGLGLYIVKQIVEKHGGTISFMSGEQGTTFTFTVPISQGGSR